MIAQNRLCTQPGLCIQREALCTVRVQNTELGFVHSQGSAYREKLSTKSGCSAQRGLSAESGLCTQSKAWCIERTSAHCQRSHGCQSSMYRVGLGAQSGLYAESGALCTERGSVHSQGSAYREKICTQSGLCPEREALYSVRVLHTERGSVHSQGSAHRTGLGGAAQRCLHRAAQRQSKVPSSLGRWSSFTTNEEDKTNMPLSPVIKSTATPLLVVYECHLITLILGRSHQRQRVLGP